MLGDAGGICLKSPLVGFCYIYLYIHIHQRFEFHKVSKCSWHFTKNYLSFPLLPTLELPWFHVYRIWVEFQPLEYLNEETYKYQSTCGNAEFTNTVVPLCSYSRSVVWLVVSLAKCHCPWWYGIVQTSLEHRGRSSGRENAYFWVAELQ